VDGVDLVDDIAQEVAADHAVLDARGRPGRWTSRRLSPLLLVRRAGRRRGPGRAAIGTDRLVLVDPTDELVAGDAVRLGGPVAPAIRRLDGGLEAFAGEFGLLFRADDSRSSRNFRNMIHVKHRQPVDVGGDALVLAHDVARGLEEAAERLGGGEGGWALF